MKTVILLVGLLIMAIITINVWGLAVGSVNDEISRQAAIIDAETQKDANAYPVFGGTWTPTPSPTPTPVPTVTPDLRATQVVNEIAIVEAEATIDQATAQAYRLTQDVRDTETARTATAEAISAEATRQAEQATAQAVAAVNTQQAAGTSTALAVMAIATDASINATQDAGRATKTAESTLFALQVADINFKRSANQTQVVLDLERRELTNTALAIAPYLLGGLLASAMVWLLAIFGRVEVDRRKLVDGLILDSKGGNLNIIKPALMGAPAAISGTNITMQPVTAELQAQTTQRAQLIEALRATNASQTVADRAMKTDPAPVITQVGRLLPESVDWKEINNRRPGQLLLGAGADGAIFARTDTPHVLVAGRTGSGKSTALKVIIAQHLLDGRRVTIFGKTAGDFEVFRRHATIIELDATDPDTAVGKLVEYLRAAWMEVIRRQKEARPTWQGVVDVIVLDELDNWAAITEDSKINSRRLWLHPRAISNEGRKAGIHLLVASQNPTADTINIGMRRNCQPVAFCLSDSAASRVVIDAPDAVGLPVGQFIALKDGLVRGIGLNPDDENITQLLRGVKPQSRPEWLNEVDYPAVEVVEVKAAEDKREKAQRLKDAGVSINEICRQVIGYQGGAAYAEVKALLSNDTAITGIGNGQ